MAEPADAHFLEAAASLAAPSSPAPAGPLTGERALELFDAQLGSRHLDLAARWLQSRGHGFYTIGSSGHEGNAAVAAVLRPGDPALLHYRSGAFFLERARQVPGQTPLRDVLLGLVAAAEEPIAGGRHKVFGSHPLNVIPQTSTIASHLPRALGVAFAIERAARLGLETPWPRDAVTVCSFGDASANHSTATGAVNAAVNCGYQGLPLPLLLVCEDNGIGISVRTPPGWVHAAYGSRPGLAYFHADGCDLADAYAVSAQAAAWVREHRRPAFLHLRTVRLMGHAGSDVESSYRTPADLAADLRRDPLLRTARLLVGQGAATPAEIIDRYEAKRAEVMALAAEVAGAPGLSSAAEVMAPLKGAGAGVPGAARPRTATGDAAGERVTVAQAINRTLGELLDERHGMVVFGEDVARKGGVYGVTRGLMRKAGAARVFDTILDEQSILGLALGFGLAGMLPVPEIQYLAYLHNAADQIRGEAATLPFFSSGRYRNPMVVRIAGYAYQKGFGGHFHNDNAVAALRDIPGIIIASPSRPDDAAGMLRACADAAEAGGRVCVMLEPIALYHVRDLHEEGDGGWLAPARGTVPVGRARTYGDGRDLTIVTFANGLRMSLRAARRLAAGGVRCRVLDLRWLAPLPVDDLLREARATGAVLIADETRRTGGVSEGVLAALADAGFQGRAARVTSEDSFIPLGGAAGHVLLSEKAVEDAAEKLVRSPR
ncbi:thiamine pyrophosphate-dependent enzyme [Actinomadura latina]|uniref:MFS transporter n=1 Tax=Actinomadura latina TaxID=163603 RepID=A0A846ZC66_9ACTN|nr:thiamine pyrophosphate-dependent enzyme [Actinomadura latina]NKZ08095.1 MFS transporter [Actinomadura latina]